jgi:thioredoxin 1
VSKVGKTGTCGKCGGNLETRELLNRAPVMITDANFDSEVLKSPLPFLLYCWAPWCPTCKTASPIIDAFAADSRAMVKVGKLNVDANPVLSSRYDIRSVPFIFIFDNGQLKEGIAGFGQKHDIMRKMMPYLY